MEAGDLLSNLEPEILLKATINTGLRMSITRF
jgi:hypothetical protein